MCRRVQGIYLGFKAEHCRERFDTCMMHMNNADLHAYSQARPINNATTTIDKWTARISKTRPLQAPSQGTQASNRTLKLPGRDATTGNERTDKTR